MRLEPGQFQIVSVREIGSGGLGTVDAVRVVDSNQSHPIGLMLARKRLSAKWSTDPGARERFEREIDTLRSMRHRSIVSVEGTSLPGEERFYVMPLYNAGSLRDVISSGRRLRIREVASLGLSIANALSYAHAMGFFHRDLKPENVLIGDNFQPVVADWGLGQFVHRHSRVLDVGRGGLMGSAYYCSAEQWATGRCDATGDVYSLGVILGELALGYPPQIHPIGSGIRVDVCLDGSSGGVYFNALIKTMTAIVPSLRHQSMNDVAYNLQRIVSMS